MSHDEADRIARRIRSAEAELRHRPERLTHDELEAALRYARSIGAAPWLIRLLEAHVSRRDDAAGTGQ